MDRYPPVPTSEVQSVRGCPVAVSVYREHLDPGGQPLLDSRLQPSEQILSVVALNAS